MFKLLAPGIMQHARSTMQLARCAWLIPHQSTLFASTFRYPQAFGTLRAFIPLFNWSNAWTFFPGMQPCSSWALLPSLP